MLAKKIMLYQQSRDLLFVRSSKNLNENDTSNKIWKKLMQMK